MLQIIKKPKQNTAKAIDFTNPEKLQSIGVEMLISSHTTSKIAITGPEVGLNIRILVTKCKPHFFYNPTINSKSLINNTNDSILSIQYQDYRGNMQTIELADPDNYYEKAINELNNKQEEEI